MVNIFFFFLNKIYFIILGLLKTSPQSQRLDILPPLLNSKSCASSSKLRPCFETASKWTNFLPTSAALHTIFVRQHNKISKKLKVIFFYNLNLIKFI